MFCKLFSKNYNLFISRPDEPPLSTIFQQKIPTSSKFCRFIILLAGHDGLELYRGDEMTSPAPFRDANIFALPLAWYHYNRLGQDKRDTIGSSLSHFSYTDQNQPSAGNELTLSIDRYIVGLCSWGDRGHDPRNSASRSEKGWQSHRGQEIKPIVRNWLQK